MVGTDAGTEQRFVPERIMLDSGTDTVLTFRNESTLPHNLTFQRPMDAATRAVVAPGESETIRFVAPPPGTYSYVCTIHPTMIGTLAVEP